MAVRLIGNKHNRAYFKWYFFRCVYRAMLINAGQSRPWVVIFLDNIASFPSFPHCVNEQISIFCAETTTNQRISIEFNNLIINGTLFLARIHIAVSHFEKKSDGDKFFFQFGGISRVLHVDTLRSGDAYMRQLTGSSVVRLQAWHLFGVMLFYTHYYDIIAIMIIIVIIIGPVGKETMQFE